ncbi:MAG: hypothetical protein KDE35_16405, partial [Geminicoccaceae bacterium]|nr:hypothetical protein [Geminicoccaceae bacterium]
RGSAAIDTSELPEPGAGPGPGAGPETAGSQASPAGAPGDAPAVLIPGVEGALRPGDLAIEVPPLEDESFGEADEAAPSIAGREAGGAPAAGTASTAGEAPDVFAAEFPCAAVEVERVSDRRLRVAGYVGTRQEQKRLLDGIKERAAGAAVMDDTTVLPPGSCDALRLATEIGTTALPGFAVALSGGTVPPPTGSEIALEVTLPEADRYFYVGFIEEDGTIRHLGPKFIDSRGIGERFLYRTGYQVRDRDQPELLIAVTSREPIFTRERPAAEPAVEFLGDLRDQFGSRPGGVAITDLVFEPPGH